MNKILKTVIFWHMILSFSDSQNFSQLSFLETRGFVLTIHGEENTLFLSENGDSYSQLKSIDISDPINPSVLDSFITTGFITDFALNGNYAYLAMADEEFGLRILDISTPGDLREVHFFGGTEANGTYYYDNHLYVADGGGLKVYDVLKADTLKFMWNYSSNQFGDGIRTYVSEGYIYLTVHNTGLFIINDNTHGLEGTVSFPEVSLGLFSDGQFAFISDDVSGFVSIDVSDPQSPSVLDTISGTGGPLSGIDVSDGYAYYADGTAGLKVIDISDPHQLEVTQVFMPLDQTSYSVTIIDSLVFLGCGNGLYILRKGIFSSIHQRLDYFPAEYVLKQNYPNPFNPVTTIRYELPRFSHVRLSVYDILGKEVALLGDRDKGPGVREVQWDATNVPSGVYFIQMRAGDFRQVRKVMVLK